MARTSTMWRYLLPAVALVVAVGVFTVLGLNAVDRVPGNATATPGQPASPAPSGPSEPAVTLAVSPTGNDVADGSPNAPLRTIQAGLDRATPGTQITLAPGVYREKLQSPCATAPPDAPITIKGPETGKDRAGRYQATLYGTGRVFSVDHSYYTLDGFTIDGQEELADIPFPTDLGDHRRVQEQRAAPGRRRPADLRRRRPTTAATSPASPSPTCSSSGAGGECVRLRNNAHDNVVADSVIQYCGMFGKGDDDDERAALPQRRGRLHRHQPELRRTADAPTTTAARTTWSRATSSSTFGSECFNVKENAHDNVF